MLYAIDGDGAFETNPHSAERAARLSTDRTPKNAFAVLEDRRRDGRAFVNGNALIIYS